MARPLWGQNPTVPVGLRLEFLLEALVHPFAAFSQNFFFAVSQEAGGVVRSIHGR
jgi:hypothetical protein